MKTKDVRPWWWWINPWLYIKRRDKAYDEALDSLAEAYGSKPYLGFVEEESVEVLAEHCKWKARMADYATGAPDETH